MSDPVRRGLPDDWDDWPQSAKVDYLGNNRSMRQLLDLILAEAGADDNMPDDAWPRRGTLTKNAMAHAVLAVEEAE